MDGLYYGDVFKPLVFFIKGGLFVYLFVCVCESVCSHIGVWMCVFSTTRESEVGGGK